MCGNAQRDGIPSFYERRQRSLLVARKGLEKNRFFKEKNRFLCTKKTWQNHDQENIPDTILPVYT